MSLTFTFHTFAERKPAHGEDIIYLRRVGSFLEGFEPRQVRVEYSWDDNEGTSACYNGEDEVEGYELKIMLDGWYADDNTAWISVDDYWAALDKAGL